MSESELWHFGVLGMKWGKRKARGAQDIKVTAKAGKNIKTKGGKRQEISQDAINAAVAKQKAKKSTVGSLSNKELESAVKRMQLEQQYTKLGGPSKRGILARGAAVLRGLNDVDLSGIPMANPAPSGGGGGGSSRVYEGTVVRKAIGS